MEYYCKKCGEVCIRKCGMVICLKCGYEVEKDKADRDNLLDACNGLLNAVCFGDHGNIKDNGYICLAVTSPEIQAIKAAIAQANEQ